MRYSEVKLMYCIRNNEIAHLIIARREGTQEWVVLNDPGGRGDSWERLRLMGGVFETPSEALTDGIAKANMAIKDYQQTIALMNRALDKWHEDESDG